jgi:hypothetical protein
MVKGSSGLVHQPLKKYMKVIKKAQQKYNVLTENVSAVSADGVDGFTSIDAGRWHVQLQETWTRPKTALNQFTTRASNKAMDELSNRYNDLVQHHYDTSDISDSENGLIEFTCSHSMFSMKQAELDFRRRTEILQNYLRKLVIGTDCKRVGRGLVSYDQYGIPTNFTTYHVPDTQQMSPEESSAAIKQLVTKSMIQQGNFAARYFSKCQGENVSVYLPGHNEPQLLLVRNCLSRHATTGLFLISLLHLMCSEGWMKGCQASGPCQEKQIRRAFNIGWPVEGWGSKKEQIVGVTITSSCGSGRCEYKNKDGDIKSFQLGGFLDRETSKDGLIKYQVLAMGLGYEKYIPYLMCYYKEVGRAFTKFAPLLLNDDMGKTLQDDNSVFEQMHTGVNLVDNGTSRLHLHRDKPSAFPAVVSSINPAKSKRKWTGGEFVLLEGGLMIEYGFRDLLFINGHQIHGVIPISPKYGQKGVSRVSVVHFSKRKSV